MGKKTFQLGFSRQPWSTRYIYQLEPRVLTFLRMQPLENLSGIFSLELWFCLWFTFHPALSGWRMRPCWKMFTPKQSMHTEESDTARNQSGLKQLWQCRADQWQWRYGVCQHCLWQVWRRGGRSTSKPSLTWAYISEQSERSDAPAVQTRAQSSRARTQTQISFPPVFQKGASTSTSTGLVSQLWSLPFGFVLRM